MRRWLNRLLRLRHDQNGASLILVTMSLPILFGMASIAIDMGYIFYVKSRLQTAADLGALAGGQLLYKQNRAAVEAQAKQYAELNLPSGWNAGNTAKVKITTTATARCLSSITALGLTCDGPSGANALEVNIQATSKLFFAPAIGTRNVTLSSTAKVSGANAAPPPLNVVIIVDSTASMARAYTGSCTGTTGTSKMACAQAGVRAMLGTLWPAVDQVQLMTFPGVTAASVAKEYCASTGNVTTVNYKTATSPPTSQRYTIIPFSTDYRGSGTPPPAGLNTSTSNLVKAAGAGTCAGLQSPGGQGTYFADAIKEAQAALVAANNALVAAGKPPRQNVIVLLGDGDANASTTAIESGTRATNQCQQAIDAAKAAATAKTWVYSIAYQADNITGSGKSSCKTDKSTVTACTTMRGIASDVSKFYSVGGNCTSTANPNTTDLVSIFKSVATSLLKMRRIPNGTT